jgi:hypothetical protein
MMAMAGGCEAWPPHDHGSGPDKRAGIRMDQHTDVLPKNLSQYIQDSSKDGRYFLS